MEKINVFIDYPLLGDGSYFGLSMPQLIYNSLSHHDGIRVVDERCDRIDVMLVFSGGSQYTGKNYEYIKKEDKKSFLNRLFRTDKIDYNRHNVRNLYYEDRIKKFKKKHKGIKLIHRLDGRYRHQCKVYGFDDTVRWIAEQADWVIFQNEYNKKLYLNECDTIFGVEKPVNIDLRKSSIIENFVDRNVFNPEGERFQLDGKIKILHVAATGMTRKGLGTLLEYANLLKNNNDIQFYLVGRQCDDPIYGKDIKKFRNVHSFGFTADRNELSKYYRSCDLLLFPTIEDCSPNTVIEAMSCGLPVLAENSGGVPELLNKAELTGGLFINHQNPIYPLKMIIEKLDYYKQNASQIVDKYHSIEVGGMKYVDLIMKVAGNQD